MNNLKGMRVAILAADGFEQVELEQPRKALDAAGAITVLISPEKQHVQGWHHSDKGDRFKVDVSLEEASSEDYAALLLPGGVMNPDHLRLLPKAVQFVKEINQQQKPIAAICHGPWLLIDAEVAQHHKLTSWPSIKLDLINAGANWIDEPAVIDRNLLTSRKPDDIPIFNQKMIELFSLNAPKQ